MKKTALLIGLICILALSLTALGSSLAEAMDAEKAYDYSRVSSWIQIPAITKEVDTFYILATDYMLSSFLEDSSDFAEVGNPEMKENAPMEYAAQASVYQESTNVFVPLYRQAGMRYAAEVWTMTGSIEDAVSGTPYEDISAALDYYFENFNNGRPFILAGHSQGSAMAKYVLKHYFKDHPEYYERMVAAYIIGYSVTKDDLEECPYLKFAAGEDDTGVIVSWNTEGPANAEENAAMAVLLPNAISINPLNWKLDDTYAPASENLGSYMVNEETGKREIIRDYADAKVIPERGVVVTNAKTDPLPEEMEIIAEIVSLFFGPDSRHAGDYAYYYNNIRDNVAKRIDAYMNSQK